MKIKFCLFESDRHNYTEECEIVNGNLNEILRDIQRVIELHEFRAARYKRDYIEQWGEEQFNRAYLPATLAAQTQETK